MTTDQLNDHIKKSFKSAGLIYKGQVTVIGTTIVISGTFLLVRYMEFSITMDFRFDNRWMVVEKEEEFLRLTKFDQLSGISLKELTLIHDTLKDAIISFGPFNLDKS